MIKTLLVTAGAVLMAASGLQAAPGGHSFGGGRGSSGAFNRPAARSSAQYSSAYRGRGGYGNRGYRGGYYGHRYYLGGVPFFYDPFLFGYYGGFGYPYGGYGYGYGYGYDNPYTTGYYNGRVADNRNRDQDEDDNDGNRQQNAAALPKAVQKQLAQRGYYRGSIDGEFGPASKSALTRFQKDNDLRASGRIDPATMKALGFEDRD